MAKPTSSKVTALTQLAVNEGNVRQTARELGIHESTLRNWKESLAGQQEILDYCALQKNKLIEVLESAAYALASSLLTSIISGVGLGNVAQQATALAIIIDKLQLLLGNATSRTESISSEYQEKLNTLRDQRDKLKIAVKAG